MRSDPKNLPIHVLVFIEQTVHYYMYFVLALLFTVRFKSFSFLCYKYLYKTKDDFSRF